MEWLTTADFNPPPGRDDIQKIHSFGNADSWKVNTRLFRTFATTRHEPIVLVKNECFVRPAGVVTKKCSRRGTSKKTVTRAVILMEVALQVLHVVSFAALAGDRHFVLSGHEDSLRVGLLHRNGVT